MKRISFQQKPDQYHKVSCHESTCAPEMILKLLFGPGIDVLSLVCLASELVTGPVLIGLPSLFPGNCPRIIDDEHHIELSEITDRLPDRLSSSWKCGPTYFVLDETRLIVTAEMLMRMESFTMSLTDRPSQSGGDDDVSDLNDDMESNDCPPGFRKGLRGKPVGRFSTFQPFRGSIP